MTLNTKPLKVALMVFTTQVQGDDVIQLGSGTYYTTTLTLPA
jgi:hypothetical protein